MADFCLTVTEISGRSSEISVQPDEKIERIVDRLKSKMSKSRNMKAKLLRGVELLPLDSSASEAGLSDGCEVQLVMVDVVTCSCIGDSGRTYETLISAEIPETVTTIENAAFAGCSSLTSVQIPESVTSVGVDAFKGCSLLSEAPYPGCRISPEPKAKFRKLEA